MKELKRNVACQMFNVSNNRDIALRIDDIELLIDRLDKCVAFEDLSYIFTTTDPSTEDLIFYH